MFTFQHPLLNPAPQRHLMLHPHFKRPSETTLPQHHHHYSLEGRKGSPLRTETSFLDELDIESDSAGETQSQTKRQRLSPPCEPGSTSTPSMSAAAPPQKEQSRSLSPSCASSSSSTTTAAAIPSPPETPKLHLPEAPAAQAPPKLQPEFIQIPASEWSLITTQTIKMQAQINRLNEQNRRLLQEIETLRNDKGPLSPSASGLSITSPSPAGAKD
ncbi:hypothetical protein BDR26DRAFT_863487 [Obelidium mucronatum]|nr:hypothetical protein BDR26DRAFT_863487 [Obelidium mucronatum]